MPSTTTVSALRLLMRAALDGLTLPARRGAALTAQIFEPLLVELRHEARLPPSSARPCCRPSVNSR